MTKMKLSWSLFLLSVSSPILCLGLADKRPTELILERDSTGSCSFVAFRDTQVVRKLPEGDVHVTKRDAMNGGERLNLVSYQEEAVWSKARELCTVLPTPEEAYFSGSPIGSDAQRVLSAYIIKDRPVKSPPLKIEPLIQSGPTNNRVDLVFFSDGCM